MLDREAGSALNQLCSFGQVKNHSGPWTVELLMAGFCLFLFLSFYTDELLLIVFLSEDKTRCCARQETLKSNLFICSFELLLSPSVQCLLVEMKVRSWLGFLLKSSCCTAITLTTHPNSSRFQIRETAAEFGKKQDDFRQVHSRR